MGSPLKAIMGAAAILGPHESTRPALNDSDDACAAFKKVLEKGYGRLNKSAEKFLCGAKALAISLRTIRSE